MAAPLLGHPTHRGLVAMAATITAALPRAVALWCSSVCLVVGFSCMLARKPAKCSRHPQPHQLCQPTTNPAHVGTRAWAAPRNHWHVPCTCNFKWWAAVAHHLKSLVGWCHLKSLVGWWACAVPPPHGPHCLAPMPPHCLAPPLWVAQIGLVCLWHTIVGPLARWATPGLRKTRHPGQPV